MPGRICGICANSETMKRAAKLIAEGLSDQKIANQLGLPTSAGRMLVSRHRRHHIEAPARLIAEAAGKGRANVEQREQTVAAAEAGDLATTFLSLDRIAGDLKIVRDRLERAAEAAEVGNQRLAVASLSGQQLRAAEVRAKLGGVGGYAAPRSDKDNAPPFVLTINFSGGRTQRIEGVPIHPDDPAFTAIPAVPLPIGDSSRTAHGDAADLAYAAADDDEAGFDEDI
jgi:hypothetical protein